jgi:glyoxylase-like metal-dependent hydrolase (beta-lactamase superfamily II)
MTLPPEASRVFASLADSRVRRMREVATGVWHWKAAHPEWKPGQTWDRMVSSYAVDTGEDVLLFDPVDVPAELRERATAVVLTCPWHRRDAPQLGLPIHVPPPDAHDPEPVRGEVFRGGDTLPFGVRALEAFEPNDLVLYVERRRAVVVGDTLVDRGNGLQVHPDWPGPGITAEEVIQRLRPLLDLPVDVVLPTHADPADRSALGRALSV